MVIKQGSIIANHQFNTAAQPQQKGGDSADGKLSISLAGPKAREEEQTGPTPGNAMFNLKDIKTKMIGLATKDQPYRSQPKAAAVNLNESQITEGELRPETGIVRRGYSTLNSAREVGDSELSQQELSRLSAQNEELKSKIKALTHELEGKSKLQDEIRSLQTNYNSVAQAYEEQKAHRPSDDEVKRLKLEVEELKAQASSKKAEYSKNLQFAKGRMDILKDQVQKLKQIAQQLRDEKVNYKGQIKSLEAVNAQFKA